MEPEYGRMDPDLRRCWMQLGRCSRDPRRSVEDLPCSARGRVGPPVEQEREIRAQYKVEWEAAADEWSRNMDEWIRTSNAEQKL
jgi:hypothetical protein